VDISFTVCLFVCFVCVRLFVRFRISPARIKLAASNIARWFRGVLGRESPILGNFVFPKALNRTNRRARVDNHQSPSLTEVVIILYNDLPNFYDDFFTKLFIHANDTKLSKHCNIEDQDKLQDDINRVKKTGPIIGYLS